MPNVDMPDSYVSEYRKINHAVLQTWALSDRSSSVLYPPEWCDGKWNIADAMDKQHRCSFALSPMRGCFAVVIGHSLNVAETYRGQGWGKFVVELQIAAMANAGYSLLMITVRADNDKMLRLAKKLGFIDCFTFANHSNKSNILCLSRVL